MKNPSVMLDIANVLSEIPAEAREQVETACTELFSFIKERGDIGVMALAIVGALVADELDEEEDK